MKDLENYISNAPNDEKALKQYGELKTKLEIINIKEAEGARIRAGQKWAQEGEKCTKYFLNLEKQRSNANTIFCLNNEKGEVIQNPYEVLDYVRDHFKGLYKEDDSISNEEIDNIFLDDGNGEVLNDEDKSILNGELTSGELLNALKKSNSLA